jgi:alkane 1-monooxygenase
MQLTKKLGFLVGYTFPAIIVLSYYLGGPNWTFAGFVYVYFITPILDELIGKDPHNVVRTDFESLTEDAYFDILVYSNVYIQFGLLFWGSYVLVFDGLTVVQSIGLVLSLGIFSANIINIAHELGHRQSPIAKFHSKIALMTVSYMHFFIEHNRGHHVHVATPQDPATSKKGQTVFEFWYQSVVGSYRSAWQIETKRLAREGKPIWSKDNEMIWFAVLPVLFCGILIAFCYLLTTTQIDAPRPQLATLWLIPLFFVVQSTIAFLSLECVNYIEHYGIVRREIAAGKYERVNPLHSWNANHLISNLMLFQLQRHSDHHAFAARPYQVLRHFDESPQLPFGYPVMILMSLVPPLWFKMMDNRLESWQAKSYDSDHISQVVKQFA